MLVQPRRRLCPARVTGGVSEALETPGVRGQVFVERIVCVVVCAFAEDAFAVPASDGVCVSGRLSEVCRLLRGR